MLLPRIQPKRAVFCFAFFMLGMFAAKIIFQQENAELRNLRLNKISETSYTRRQQTTDANSYGSRTNYSILEVDDLVKIFHSRYDISNNDLALKSEESYITFLKRLNSLKKKGIMLITESKTNAQNSAERFQRGINQFYMYDPKDEHLIENLLKDLSSLPIVSAEKPLFGSQMKIKLIYSDGSNGYFKPLRRPKTDETPRDMFFFNDFERPTAEIAGFHLDRALGFHRVVPTIGRVLNITKDLSTYLSDTNVVEFKYTSPAGNLCFVAKCPQYCGPQFPICGQQTILEGSISASLPPFKDRLAYTHPYRRSYKISGKATWEEDENYCNLQVKNKTSFYRLLEFMDLSIFDFLIGNLDRHEYELFTDLGETGFSPFFDNGRGFGRAKYDCKSCLAPLRQCCLIRLSTLTKLIKLYQGPDSLSQVMRRSLNSDPLSPILDEHHLDALDRRLGKVIKTISHCITNGRSWDDVVIDDVFTH